MFPTEPSRTSGLAKLCALIALTLAVPLNKRGGDDPIAVYIRTG